MMRFPGHPARSRAPSPYACRISALALVASFVACNDSTDPGGFGPPTDLAACSSAPILSTSPAASADFTNIIPLGNLNPGGHTFPSDHIYFIVPRAGPGFGEPLVVPVVSPGEIRITGVASSDNTLGPRTEYSLYFFGCADVQFYFHHIHSLDPSLAAAIGPVDQNCNTYSTGGATYTRCSKDVDVALHGGDPIGSAGAPGIAGFDLGAYDRRTPRLAYVNQSFPSVGSDAWNTFHAVCPLDYFASPVKEQLEAKLGGGPAFQRTIAPLCGEIMQDVPNTLQGRWLRDATQQEDPHLALVHDNIDPTTAAISMGTSVPSIPLGVYRFTPSAATPRVNVDFQNVMSDGLVYCYDDFGAFGFGGTLHILIELTSNTSVRIEGFSGSSCGSPSSWAFTSAAVAFDR